MKLKPWKTTSTETILDHSKWLKIEKHSIQLPSGETLHNWPWIITHDYVIVIAVTEENEFLCFFQTKYAVDGTTYAPVGGYLEAGEQPIDAARRELLEETGYMSDKWQHLGSFRVDGNHGCGTAHLFLAEKCMLTARPNRDDLEEMQLLKLNRKTIETLLTNNEFKVLPWTTAFLLAFQVL